MGTDIETHCTDRLGMMKKKCQHELVISPLAHLVPKSHPETKSKPLISFLPQIFRLFSAFYICIQIIIVN